MKKLKAIVVAAALALLASSSHAIADDMTPSGSYSFTLTRDIEGCVKPFAVEPKIAQCRTIPKGTRVNPKERAPAGFILTCVADGKEPKCLPIESDTLISAKP